MNRSTKKRNASEKCDADKVPFSVFFNLCKMLTTGSEEDKVGFMFDFIDLDKSDLVDKNEISVVARHLLACRMNSYGDDVLFESPDDMDLFWDIPLEVVTQLKANKFAHDIVVSAHGGARQMGMAKKTFKMWYFKGGKRVEELKDLFS